MEHVLATLCVLIIFISCCTGSDILIKYYNSIQNIALTRRNIYIGTENSLRKLDYDLKQSTNRTTGPKIDNPVYCAYDAAVKQYHLSCVEKEKVKKTEVNNFNQILLVTDMPDKSLLSCGTLYQGACEFLSLDTLNTIKDIMDLTPDVDILTYVSANLPNATTVAVLSKDRKVLYVAHTVTYRIKIFDYNMGHMIAALPLKRDQFLLYTDKAHKIIYKDNLYRIYNASIEATYKNAATYSIYYTGAFVLHKHVYFTTIQRQNYSSNSLLVSKLVRIKENVDIPLKIGYYFENILSCSYKNIKYNVLLSTSILNVTDVDLHGFKTGDQIIFAIFTKSKREFTMYSNSYQDFAICYFSLNSINIQFDSIEKGKCDTVPKAPWIDSISCDTGPSDLPLSYAPSDSIEGTLLHRENRLKFQAIYAHKHARGISLFVSSSDHSLLKFAVVRKNNIMKLHEYSRRGFPADGKNTQMFFQMVLDPTETILFMISKDAVAKLPVVDCISRKTCVDCLSGPVCGWCSLMNKCTMKDNCQKNMHYVDKKTDDCPNSNIQDSIFTVEKPRKITFTTVNMPTNVTYKCKIGSTIIPLTRAGSTFTCDQFDFGNISTSSGEVKLNVSIVAGSSLTPVVKSVITVFRCSSFICQQCVYGKYTCGWCIPEMTCSDDSSGCSKSTDWIPHKGRDSNGSSQICPRILGTPNAFLASSMEYKVTLNGKLLPEPYKDKFYKCVLSIAGKQIESKAKWINSSQLLCQKQRYAYEDDKLASVLGHFTVTYGGVYIESSKIQVTLYKCQVKKYCSLCNSTVGWKCGWCGMPPVCQFRDNCVQHSVESCPNPVIDRFTPSKASIGGTTLVVIDGTDLGLQGDVKSVTIAGVNCKPIREKQIPFVQVVCNLSAQAVKNKTEGYVNISISSSEGYSYGTSKKKFYFVKPEVLSFEPVVGPCSGGTILTILGTNLDVGNNVEIRVGGEKCTTRFGKKRNSENITCITPKSKCPARRRRDTSDSQITAIFDGYRVSSPKGKQFTYMMDPTITSVSTNKANKGIRTFVSGGQVFKVEGQRFNIIQNPMMTFKLYGKPKPFKSSCSFESAVKLKCLAPNISSSVGIKVNETTVQLGFKMADVKNLINFINITVVADPFFFNFDGKDRLKELKSTDLILKGSGISVLDKRDVKVEIAGIPCKKIGLDESLMCTLPTEKELSAHTKSKRYGVKVTVGEGGLVYDIGFVRFYKASASSDDYALYFGIAAAVVIVLIILIISVCVLYRRRHLKDKKDYKKDLQLHMDVMESQYARECKEAFAEYQIDRDDLTEDVNQENIPMREFRQFAMQVLYPGLDSHPILEDNKDERPEWKTCMQSFIELLKDEEFILTFIRTLEGQHSFQMTDRCIVASLLMVSLQDDIGFVTGILKELLTDLINKAGSGKRPPKLLLRRTESIAEKLLTNWLAYTLYNFLRDVVGKPLFQLFTAINILLDKEPVDALTFDAKNSLSEDKLLRTKIDFRAILLNVEYVHYKDGGTFEGIPVISTDTINQTKEKIIKYIYKNRPYSEMPLPGDLQLGHVGSNGTIRYMQDCDASNLVEGEWKKLNTIEFLLNLYKIPECSCLRLSVSTHVPSSNGSALMDDSLPNVTIHSSVSSTPILCDYGSSADPKLYHMVKPTDQDFYQSHKADVRHSKMMAEVYLTRLLKTKETLLSFVNNLFEAIFGSCESGRVIPPSIKFLFDFLDSEAEKLSIDDSEVHHTWKNNSLPLRFWINMIKNPNFVFDVQKSNTVDSCLSVIAQLFMDSCSPDDHRLGMDSPSNKLLYAKEIPGYKKEVKRFYKEVRDSKLDEENFYEKLAEISSLYGQSFNSCNAAFELMSYAVKYKVKLMDNLEDNSYEHHAEKLQEIMEKIPDD